MSLTNPTNNLNLAKWGLRSTFFFLRTSVSVATASMADINWNTHSSDAAFGFAILIGNAGIMLGNYLGGIGVHRFGSKKVIRSAIFGISLAPVGFGFAHHLWQISAISFIAGLFGAYSNVSVNMQGGMIESGVGRSLLPTFHGSWTLGAFSASLFASILAQHISLTNHLIINGILSFLCVSASSLVLLPSTMDQRILSLPENQNSPDSTRQRINPVVGLLAFVSALSLLSESSVGDWSSILLHEKYGVSVSAAALGYTVFALGQIIGRFAVGRRIDRIGVVAVIRTGGLIGGTVYLVGSQIVRLQHLPSPSLVLVIMCLQYFLIGLCIAPMPPAFAILAYRVPKISAAKAIAQVQVMSAFAFLLGRLLMSGLTKLLGLQTALVLPALTLLATGFLANKIAERA